MGIIRNLLDGSANQSLWGYQDFAAGVITGTSVTITANSNGTGAAFSNFMNYASIYRSDSDDYVYTTGFLGMFAGLVAVSSQSGTSITLNKIPAATTPVRIWWLYTGIRPGEGYILPPSNVLDAAATIKLDTLFITEADISALIQDNTYISWTYDGVLSTLTPTILADTSNVANTLVARDANSDFEVNNITLHSLTSDADAGIPLYSNNLTEIGILGYNNNADVNWNGNHSFDVLTASQLVSTDASKNIQTFASNATSSLLFLGSANGATPSWQVIPTQGQLIYYWTNTASSIATYYQQTADPFATLNSISNASVTNGQLLATFATNVSNPNLAFLPAGEYSNHIHAAKTAGTKDAYIRTEIWEVNASGVDIAKIADCGPSVILTGVNAEYIVAQSNLQYTFASTSSRIITKVYAVVSGGGSAPTIVLYMGAASDSRTSLPGPVANITNFLPYTGAVSNTNTGLFTITSAGFIGPLTGNASTATLASTVTTNANLTGDVTSVGNATTIGALKVTNAMLAGSIANAKLSNSSITIGSTNISLGATSLTLAGLTSVTATTFTGALVGNASTASAVPLGGITGLGIGIPMALQINVGTAGSPVINGGALGTPSSGVATNLTGTASGLNAGTAATWTTARNLAGNSVNGSANVAFANKFIVQGTADAGLSGAQFLGALATGIVKNTTTTGVLSIAVAGDFPTLNQNTTGSAATLTTGRTISITGDVSYTSPSFNGSSNITAAATIFDATVTGKVLGGLSISGGSISSADSILTAFGKVQNQINGVLGGAIYQGVWNATTNSPTLTSSIGTKGYYYVVSVAGSTNLNGITDWKVGDWAIFNGSTWDKVDNTDAVSSVNGSIGAVSLVGTANRITVSGTTWDISSTFEALLGKVANPLSQFAATTSLQLKGVISDETGSGSLVFANAPTLINPILGDANATTLTATGLITTSGNISSTSGLIVSAKSTIGDSVISSQNYDTTATSKAVLEAVSGNGGAGGDALVTLKTNSGGWSGGLDKSDSDKYKMSFTYNDVATSTFFTANTTGIAFGDIIPRQRLTLGSITSLGTTTPECIDLGGSYSSVAGANLKVKLYNDGTTIFGLGISSASFDYVSAGSHKWYNASTIGMSLSASGVLNIPALTASTALGLDASKNVVSVPYAYGQIFATGTQSISNALENELTSTYWNGTAVTNGGVSFSAGRLTVSNAGFYQLSANCSFASNSTGYRGISILKNGSFSNRIGYENKIAVSGDRTGLTCSGGIYLNAGDYVSVYVFQNSGGSLNTDTAVNGNFSITKTGGL